MSGDLSQGGRGTSNLGRILAFIAIGFTLVLAGIFIARAVSSSGDTATALFEVSNEPASVLEGTRLTIQEFEILKKTQLALLKSNYVLTAAIRPPGVGSLSVLAGKDDPVEWLQENLVVDFPQNGEILSISLKGDEMPEDLVRLVDAVCRAYKDEVVNELRQRRLAVRDLLARNLENVNKELKRKLEEYLDIAKETGKFVGANGELLQQIAAKQLDRIEEEIIRLESSLAVEIGDDETKRGALENRVEQLAKQKTGLTAELASRVERNADLETREEELKQLQQIANEMSVKLERLDIEASSPDRIRQRQQAVIARD
jgi:polysaccharide biosynthesis transport protein